MRSLRSIVSDLNLPSKYPNISPAISSVACSASSPDSHHVLEDSYSSHYTMGLVNQKPCRTAEPGFLAYFLVINTLISPSYFWRVSKLQLFLHHQCLIIQIKQILSVLYQRKNISQVGQTGECMQKLRVTGEANFCLLENREAGPLPMHRDHLYSPQKNMGVSEIVV